MIIWISSYPKSGNTWVRAFLSTYLNSTDGKFNFSLLDKIGEFPDHNILNKFMDSKDFYNLSEVSKHWIKVQELINSNKELTFLKTHSSLCNINGNKFTNTDNTLAIVHIVRDPRNIVLSMAHHFGITQEESYKIISDKMYIIYPKKNNQPIPSTLVSSWNNHYLSWKNSDSINKIVIKYEDLIKNTKDTFEKIINFLNEQAKIKYDEKKIINSINVTQFDNLKKNEDKYGFNMGQKNKFFYLGKKNDWKNLLDPGIGDKINLQFKSEMEELGYI